MANKVIIEVRINEYTMREPNPNVPYSPEEIANQALECWRGKEVTLLIRDAATAVHLEDNDLYVVIMPVRVSEPVECPQNKKDGGVPAQADETTKASQAE